MTWAKQNLVKILVILLHSLMVPQLILNAYQVPLGGRLDFLAGTLAIVLPTALFALGLLGLVKDLRFSNVLLVLGGGLLLWQSFRFDVDLLLESIALINDKLAAAQPLLSADFRYLLDSLSLAMTLLLMGSLFSYPWNILSLDGVILLFLWSVGYLPDKEANLRPFVLLWSFLLVHQRVTIRDGRLGNFNGGRHLKGQRMFQTLISAALIGGLSLTLARDIPGPYYDDLWAGANQALMPEDALPGSVFLEAFSLSSTGYQDSATALGGDIRIDTKRALLLTGDVPSYLRGNTKYRYTGGSWDKNDLVYRTDHRASSLVQQSYGSAPVRSMTILPAGLVSASLFVPSYPKSVVLSQGSTSNRVFYGAQDQTFVTLGPVAMPYTVLYYDQLSVEALALDRVNERVGENNQRYLELPDSITPRTIQLVADITKGLDTKTDKALAISRYLRENYRYSLTPGKVPRDQDFTDYFLFDQPEGYCVYFATALTVMLRIAGIPARYAEGFKVSNERDGSGRSIVRNSDAHAWSEVLTDASVDLWTIWDATGSAREHQAGTGGEQGYTPAMPREETLPGAGTRAERPAVEETKPSPDTRAPGETPASRGDPAGEGEPWAGPLLLLVLAAALAALSKGWRMGRILREPSGRKLLDYVIILLEESGQAIAPAATLTEIAQAIADEELRGQFSAFVGEYYRSSYGKEQADLSEQGRASLLAAAYRVHRKGTTPLRSFLRRYLR